MLKKIGAICFSILLVIPAMIPAFSIVYAPETRVCGIDGKNYPNLDFALANGIAVSYDFPCEYPTSEEGLFERTEPVELTGMLLEFDEKENKSQFYVRDNFDKKEHLVLSESKNHQSIDSFVPGDQLRIVGNRNKNTGIIDASIISDLSQQDLETNNCVVQIIDKKSESLSCKNESAELIFNINRDTRFVIALNNSASVDDLREGDTVRVRHDKDKLLKMLIVTNRGITDFLRNHIFISDAVYLSNENNDGNYIEVELLDQAIAKVIRLKINADTRIVRKYFGKMEIENFNASDDLRVVVRLKDDANHEAILIKNITVWK